MNTSVLVVESCRDTDQLQRLLLAANTNIASGSIRGMADTLEGAEKKDDATCEAEKDLFPLTHLIVRQLGP